MYALHVLNIAAGIAMAAIKLYNNGVLTGVV
jgi:hypothetical protein